MEHKQLKAKSHDMSFAPNERLTFQKDDSWDSSVYVRITPSQQQEMPPRIWSGILEPRATSLNQTSTRTGIEAVSF